MEICEQIKRRVPDHFEQLVFCLSSAVFHGIGDFLPILIQWDI